MLAASRRENHLGFHRNMVLFMLHFGPVAELLSMQDHLSALQYTADLWIVRAKSLLKNKHPDCSSTPHLLLLLCCFFLD